jgi:hypothetical protein
MSASARDGQTREVRTTAANTRWLPLTGVGGGLLYLTGDFLFYGHLGSGSAFRSLAVMAQRGDTALIAGAIVAPLASAGYILGTLAVFLRVREKHPRAAIAFLASWSSMFLTGVAYHAVYATRGFAAKLADPLAAGPTLSRIEGLLSTLFAGEATFGSIGTLALAAAILRGDSGYPRGILVFMPTLWSLATFVPRAVPAPAGGLIAGGWINGWFCAFFVVAWLSASRHPASSPPNGRGRCGTDAARGSPAIRAT